MTEPTDEDLLETFQAACDHGDSCNQGHSYARAQALRAVLAKWGTPPAVAGEPVAPDFFTACAWHEGGGVGGWIALPGYSNETEHGVKHLVLDAAHKEGYKGTAAGRLLELGWEIRPVYLTPQPTQAQAGAVPLTDEQAKEVLWSEHLRWMQAAGLDTEGMSATGEWLDHWLTYVRAIECAHGIKGGQHEHE